jgi:hypothetical protein
MIETLSSAATPKNYTLLLAKSASSFVIKPWAGEITVSRDGMIGVPMLGDNTLALSLKNRRDA